MTKKIILFLAFSVSITTLFAQPANDNCMNAIPLINLDGACVDFNSTASTFDLANGDCVNERNDRNIWFSFVAQGPNLDISADGGSNEIFVTLISFDPDPCDFASATQLQCGSATGGNNAIPTVDFLITGNTYFISVNIGNDAEAAGTICVNNPDPNAVAISLPSFGKWQLTLLGFMLLVIGVTKLNLINKIAS